GEICQSVPAYAGLRRFYSCAICNNGVPPSMPLTRHQKIPLLQLPPLRTQSVFSFIDEIYCLRNFSVLVYFVILEAIICLM
ncbi:hypothetical protein EYZ03_20560, partial [Shigella dysenteriae]|nr:hypothetical protein [Shigella dysenteriae]EGA1631089.1 hypothetical protein [Shigella dysenteriae]